MMRTSTQFRASGQPFGAAGGVRVLLASDRMAARLTLEALLRKSGYLVEAAVSAPEAMERMEAQPYDLVLCDLERDSGELRKFAERQPYRPATATVHVSHEHGAEEGEEVLIGAVDVPRLLTQIADIVADRAFDRSERASALARRKTA